MNFTPCSNFGRMLIIISRVKFLGKNNFMQKKVCIMKRSRAFILSEQLMAIMLQAGFILVLCMSFYMLTTFYAQTQQIMTARNHAERVISFMDDKIRNAGLGLWNCGNTSSGVRSALPQFTSTTGKPLNNFKLPLALMENETNTEPKCRADKTYVQYGSVLTVLYGDRDLSNGAGENILIIKNNENELKLLNTTDNNPKNVRKLFGGEPPSALNINCYAVTEATGIPMYISSLTDSGIMTIAKYGSCADVDVADGSELIPLKCMQMLVHGADSGEGRQFAFRELKATSTNVIWGDTYNQEKGILDIYMELDTTNKVFTLYVLATGGYDANLNNSRPELWPADAQPSDWDNSTYRHHIVYVSRASWKLNNIPKNFRWN